MLRQATASYARSQLKILLDTSVCQQCSKCYEPEGGIHLLPAIKADEYHKYTFPLQYLGKSFPLFWSRANVCKPRTLQISTKEKKAFVRTNF